MNFRRDVERLLRSFELLRHEQCMVFTVRKKLPLPIHGSMHIRDDDLRLAKAHRIGNGLESPILETSHHLAGSCDRVFLPILQASRLVVSNWNNFQNLFGDGCKPEGDGLAFVDVVLELLKRSESVLVEKPQEFIQVSGECRCSMSLWKSLTTDPDRLSVWPLVGIAKEDVERIGPNPAEVIVKRTNFIDDSILAIGDLLESIEQEQPVAPVDVPVDPLTEDGLCSSSRVLTWGGVRYSLTLNQLAVVKVLHDAYSKGKPDVGLAELKNKCDSAALDESFSKVFQLKRNGKKSYNPVLDVIESLSQGTYRLNDKKKF